MRLKKQHQKKHSKVVPSGVQVRFWGRFGAHLEVPTFRKHKKTQRKGIVNIGYRPTFEKKKLILEAHIFGLKKNLYDKKIKIMLIKFIRNEKKFRNILELKKQIAKDIKIAKQI